MKFRTTLILALILAVGIVAVVILNKQEEKQEKAQERASQLLNIEQDDVQEIVLHPSGLYCVRDSAEWKIVSPIETGGDENAINTIASMFEQLKKERTISTDSTQYVKFGLEDPDQRLIVVHNEGTDTIFVGDKSPTGSFVFARMSGSPDVFLTSTTLQRNVDKELFDLRNKDVLGFEKSAVRSFTLKNQNGVFAMEKTAGEWNLTSPGNFQSDNSEVNTILNRLNSENVEEFVDEDPASLARYGITDPVIQVDLMLGPNMAKKTLFIGDSKDDGYYAKDESRAPVFLVDSAFVSVLNADLYTLRNKQLADFMSGDVDQISLEYSGQTVVCNKDTSGTWFITEPLAQAARSWKISSITRKASQLEVVDFVDDDPSALSPYGLDNPQVQATFFKEGQVLLNILLGDTVGDNVYAKKADQNSVVLVEKSVLEELTPDVNDLIKEQQQPDTTAVDN